MWVLGFLGPIWSVSEPQMDVFGALLGRFGTVDLELSAGGGLMCGRLCMGGIIARPFANIKAIIVRVSVQTCWCQNTSRLRKNSSKSSSGLFPGNREERN